MHVFIHCVCIAPPFTVAKYNAKVNKYIKNKLKYINKQTNGLINKLIYIYYRTKHKAIE